MKRLLAAIIVFSVCTARAQDRMTPEMLWSLKRVSAQEISPDGKWLYFTSRTYDVQTEKSSVKRYMLNISSGEQQEWTMPEGKTIISRGKDAWYATDNNVIYSSKDQGRSWNTFFTGIEGASNIQVSPDGKWVAYSREVPVKPMMGRDLYPDLQKTSAYVFTDLNYRHWDTWEDGKFSHVFIASVENGVHKDLNEGEPFDVPGKPFGGAEDFVWSPDSKGLVYVSKKKFGKEYAQSTNTDIYYYELGSGRTVNWTANMMGYDTNPAFSPDGRRIAWTSMRRDGFEADKNNIMVADIGRGGMLDVMRMNLTADWDETVHGFAWSRKGDKIYFVAPVKGTEQLFSVDVPADFREKIRPQVRQITKGKFDVNGIVGEAGSEMIVTRSDMNHASEIYAVNLDSGSMAKLTHENDETYKKIRLSRTKLRMVKTTDGQDMGVWVIYPPGFDSTKKYPALLYCQGGPQSALTQFYSFRWNFQLMAANGYIVVAPNRRGMPGWGTQWNAAISKDWGGQAMKDYLAAIDDVAQEKYVDRERIGCVGASYGGYSVFMLAGMHDRRFRTFIAHDGLFDLKSWYGTTEELWFANWDIGGSYWAKPAHKSYELYDPSNFVDKWDTPIMIVQGGTDYRVPIEQGLEAFQAAQLRGIKSKLLYFPDENHWVLHPQNALVWQREFYKWLDETLKTPRTVSGTE